MQTSIGVLALSDYYQVKGYYFVGAGHARDIRATLVAVISHRSRAWPAPTNVNKNVCID